jgi:hypothetical protein
VSSVTVLQHLPFAEQAHAIERLRAALVEGGNAIVLENVRHQEAHVFSRSIGEWVELFGRQGFQVLTVRRYDYSPTLRAIRAGHRLVRGALSLPSRSGSSGGNGGSVSAGGDARESAGRGASIPPAPASRALRHAQRAAVCVDSRLEAPLVRRNARLPTVHAGFLFRAV